MSNHFARVATISNQVDWINYPEAAESLESREPVSSVKFDAPLMIGTRFRSSHIT